MNSQPPSTAVNQTQEKILKNTSYLTIAFVLQKVLSFIYFILIARSLGPVDLGFYDPAKSLIPILLILIDFSLSVVLVREIARTPEKTEEFLGNIISIKAIFAFFVILAMGLYTNFSHHSTLIKTVLYLDAIIVVLDTFTLTFFAVFRGQQNMRFEALGMIGTQILTMSFGLISLKFHWGLPALFVAVGCGSIFNFIFSLLMLRIKAKIRLRPRWNASVLKMLLVTALPFAISAMFTKMYTYTDRYMLLWFAGQKYVGWYVTANKMTYAFEFLPSAFSASIFPAMSAFYLTSKIELAKTFEKAIRYLIILAIPMSLGIFALADNIILKIYGPDFITAAVPLRIMISGLLVVFLNFPVGAFLNACNRQTTNTINMIITVVINISLNLLLIKKYTFNGAAFSALVSGIILFFLGLYWVGKIAPYDKAGLLKMLGKALISGSIMMACLWLIKDQVSLFVSIPAGMLIYALAIFAVKGITKSDVFVLTHIFSKKI